MTTAMLVNGFEVQLIADGSRGEDNPATPETLDFAEMKRNGIVAFWTRASNGILADPTYPIFRENCYKAGMPFGAFGTIYTTVDPTAQANKFIEIVSGQRLPELSHAIDWEVDGVTWQMVDTWLAKVEAKWPGWEILNYTRAEYLKRSLPPKTHAKYKRFQKIPVWQAHYYTLTPDPLPDGFMRVMWQFTGKGTRASYSSTGESKELDLDYFFGTLTDFNTRFGLGGVTPPPVEIPPALPNENAIRRDEIDRFIALANARKNQLP